MSSKNLILEVKYKDLQEAETGRVDFAYHTFLEIYVKNGGEDPPRRVGIHSV